MNLAKFYRKVLKKYIKYMKKRNFFLDGNDISGGSNSRNRYFISVKKNIEDILKPLIEKNVNVYSIKSFENRLKICTTLMEYCTGSLLKHLSPNTIIIKIQNFKSFLNASKNMKIVLAQRITDTSVALEDFIKEDLGLIIKRLNSCRKSQELKKLKKDRSQAIFAEDVEQVLNSSYYTKGWICLLGLFKESPTHPQSEYSPSKLRDILMFQLIVATSTRSGVISNLTMEEYNELEKLPGLNENSKPTIITTTTTTKITASTAIPSPVDLYVLKCHTHKTSFKYGEAPLFLTPMMKEGLDSYIKFIRPLLMSSFPLNATKISTSKEIKNIFITDRGKYFSPQSVYNSMRRLAEQCGLKKKFATTRNRKGTTTEIAENQPHLRKNVCHMMCHSEKTADKFYKSYARLEDLKDTFCQTMKGKSLIKFSDPNAK
nr:MAG: hypothetical protein [Porcellio scaber clopovirus]